MIRELENFQRIHRRVCILLDSRRDVRVGSAENLANQWRSRSILEFKKLHVELYATTLSYILKCPLLCSFLQDLQFSLSFFCERIVSSLTIMKFRFLSNIRLFMFFCFEMLRWL